MRSTRVLLLITACSALFISNQLFAEPDGTETQLLASPKPSVAISQRPEWVEPFALKQDLSNDSAKNSGGELYLMLDQQVNATGAQPTYFFRYVIELYSVDSIEKHSQISINFSPAYQQLTLHDARVIRNQEVIDKLRRNNITLMQRERQMERLIYDGRWTASVVLDDIRRGDILEYSYSITGANPALANHFSMNISLQWGVPLQQQLFRMLWPTDRALQVKTPEPEQLHQHKKNGITEYRLTQNKVARLDTDGETPDWYNPWPSLRFSSLSTWREVAHWALPHYQTPGHPNIKAVAETIRQQVKDPKRQASLALQYVQDEIRYLGIEMGEAGFIPSPPEQTLERRYGDCKDKTLLLLAILNELQIAANPVLVNTEIGKRLDSELPSVTAFNHVIVKIIVDGTDYWVDPTISMQKGTLDTIYQPDYGYVLEVTRGTLELTQPQLDYSYHRKIIYDTFDITEGLTEAIKYTVKTQYQGHYAESMRRWLSSRNTDELEKSYLDYYDEYYSDIELLDSIQIDDNLHNNIITTTEHYHFFGDWQESDNGSYLLSFYTDSFRSLINKPESRRRNSPFALDHPRHQRQTIKVLLPQDWNLTSDNTTIDFESFTYSSTLEYLPRDRAIVGTYEFRSLRDHVSSEKTRDYIRHMDNIFDDLDFYIYHNNPQTAEPIAPNSSAPRRVRAFSR